MSTLLSETVTHSPATHQEMLAGWLAGKVGPREYLSASTAMGSWVMAAWLQGSVFMVK